MTEHSDVVTNPFSDWKTGPRLGEHGIHLVALVEAVLHSTVQDHDVQMARDLFAELDHFGPDAWRETALTLTQFLLSTGTFDLSELVNDVDAVTNIGDTVAAQPMLTATMAAFLNLGRDAAKFVLHGVRDPAVITDTTQLLFCRAAVEIGYPPDQVTALAATLATRRCAGPENRVGQAPCSAGPRAGRSKDAGQSH